MQPSGVGVAEGENEGEIVGVDVVGDNVGVEVEGACVGEKHPKHEKAQCTR